MRLSVIECETAAIARESLIAHATAADLATSDRVIIYTITTTLAEEIASAIRSRPTGISTAAHFHGNMSSEAKKTALRQWIEGNFIIMVSTSAFGAGVDYASVRRVLHFGGSASLLNYIQECGRGGRDGRPFDAVTFTSPDLRRRNEEALRAAAGVASDEAPTIQQIQALHNYLTSTASCRRGRLTSTGRG
jgi:ATP-dependent DNA helicase RecQ